MRIAVVGAHSTSLAIGRTPPLEPYVRMAARLTRTYLVGR